MIRLKIICPTHSMDQSKQLIKSWILSKFVDIIKVLNFYPMLDCFDLIAFRSATIIKRLNALAAPLLPQEVSKQFQKIPELAIFHRPFTHEIFSLKDYSPIEGFADAICKRSYFT